jgi:hypothetical protein
MVESTPVSIGGAALAEQCEEQAEFDVSIRTQEAPVVRRVFTTQDDRCFYYLN